MDDEGLTRLILPREMAQRRVQREGRVQLHVAVLRKGAAKTGEIGVADGRNRAQPVHRAAQHDDDETRIARSGGAGEGGNGAAEGGRDAETGEKMTTIQHISAS